MSLIITLVLSVCNPVPASQIKSEMAKLQQQHPEATIKLRVDKKCLE